MSGKLTAEESCRQVLKTIADACDQETLARAIPVSLARLIERAAGLRGRVCLEITRGDEPLCWLPLDRVKALAKLPRRMRVRDVCISERGLHCSVNENGRITLWTDGRHDAAPADSPMVQYVEWPRHKIDIAECELVCR